jgi:hypothetical protein
MPFKQRWVRRVQLDDPRLDKQPTWWLCRLASIHGSRTHLAGVRYALKQRRVELLAELAEIEQADQRLQQCLFFDIRRWGRFHAFKKARAS